MSQLFSRIEWQDASQTMPDADTTVMIYSPAEDEPVWLGYHDGEHWRDIAGSTEGEPCLVTHWADFPAVQAKT